MDKKARARRAARAAQLRRERQRRVRWISAVAVAVLLAAGLIGVVAWQADRPGDSTAPVAADGGTGLPVGTGPVTVEVYLDFLCPACRQFDQAARPTLASYLEQDRVTLVYHPISILDRQTTTQFSTRAAAAAGCASDGDRLDEFVAVLMDRQPAGGGGGLSNDEIVQAGVAAGLPEATFGQCVREGTYQGWVRNATDAAFDRGITGTPTVLVDGQQLSQLSLAELVAAIEAAG